MIPETVSQRGLGELPVSFAPLWSHEESRSAIQTGSGITTLGTATSSYRQQAKLPEGSGDTRQFRECAGNKHPRAHTEQSGGLQQGVELCLENTTVILFV